jgi:hypothetical protein
MAVAVFSIPLRLMSLLLQLWQTDTKNFSTEHMSKTRTTLSGVLPQTAPTPLNVVLSPKIWVRLFRLSSVDAVTDSALDAQTPTINQHLVIWSRNG